MKKKVLEKKYNLDSNLLEIGVDEVGRGPMFGRVYSAAVILPKNDTFKYELLKDSKKFTSEKKIQDVAYYIKENCISWSVSYVDEKTIDNINIRNATHNSMHNSIKKIMNNFTNTDDLNNKFYILIDGNDFKPYTYLNNNKNMIEQVNHILIEGGDNKYCSIAAASIIAKVERDNYIKELCNCYTKLNDYYNLNKNKGYGTRNHLEGIEKYGISPWHRKSYGCCKYAHVNDDNFYL
tara:strand:- start:286 stop:993 length:708 start_codon:yes stop_codon:yes gene_type:complete